MSIHRDGTIIVEGFRKQSDYRWPTSTVPSVSWFSIVGQWPANFAMGFSLGDPTWALQEKGTMLTGSGSRCCNLPAVSTFAFLSPETRGLH